MKSQIHENKKDKLTRLSKKLISLSVLVLACSLYSCSGDSIPQAGGKTVFNDDIGGQSGQLPPPPRPKQAIKHLSGDRS